MVVANMGRHSEVLKADGPVLLPTTDPRSQKITKIMTRLVTALEEQDHTVVSGASWPPRHSNELGRVISEREASEGRELEERYHPSGVAKSTFMPFRPQTSNPLKKLETADWNLYVIDLVSSTPPAFSMTKHELILNRVASAERVCAPQ